MLNTVYLMITLNSHIIIPLLLFEVSPSFYILLFILFYLTKTIQIPWFSPTCLHRLHAVRPGINTQVYFQVLGANQASKRAEISQHQSIIRIKKRKTFMELNEATSAVATIHLGAKNNGKLTQTKNNQISQQMEISNGPDENISTKSQENTHQCLTTL